MEGKISKTTLDSSYDLTRSGSWILWAMLCIFMNLQIGGGIWGSTLLLGWIILLWVISDLRYGGAKIGLALLVIISVTTLAAAGLLWNTGKELRIYEEMGKILLLALGTLALKDSSKKTFQCLTYWIPIGMAALAVVTYLSGTGNTYDPLRFNLYNIGSANSSAYAVVISLLMAHFSWDNEHSQLKKFTMTAVILVLLITLMATFSRGGLLQYIAGILAFTERKKIFLVALFCATLGILVFVPNIAESFATVGMLWDLQSLQENARLGIWTSLIGDLTTNPWNLLVGFGPGSIYVRAINVFAPVQMQNSAHSLYIEIFYSFGIIGIALLLYWLWKTLRRIIHSTVTDSWKKLRLGIFSALAVGGLFDSYIFAAQLLWLSCIMLAILEKRYTQETEITGL